LTIVGAMDAPTNELTTFSLEQMNRYEGADILLSPWFFPEDQEAMESNPLFRSLPAVQQGRYMPLLLDIAQAGYIESTLSVRWVVPLLAGAIIEAAEGRGKRVG
jgi:ABC-type Fe3+-hydroxamate transport system substrate-binding protein